MDAIPSYLHFITYTPTQKPVALFAYLIDTYSTPGDLILDNCSGSATTAIAALETGRRFICIERDDGYYRIGRDRIDAWHAAHTGNGPLFDEALATADSSVA